ncbi:hypothetical protein FRB99_008834 [Tulasnella sp. 403]|nr:hypothetical protein FRB99_008834 [Tulasnella sp. 403]
MDPSKTPQAYRLPTYAPAYTERYTMNHPNPADSPSAARNPYEKKPRSEAGSPTPSRHHPQDEMDTNNAPDQGEEEGAEYEEEYEEDPKDVEAEGHDDQEETQEMEEVTAPHPHHPPDDDVFTAPTFPPRQIAPFPKKTPSSRTHSRTQSRAASPTANQPQPKTPSAAPVLSLVNAQAEQGKDAASSSRVTFEESTPKATRNWTGPIDTPAYDPYAFYGSQPKKTKTATEPSDNDVVIQDDAQKLAEENKKRTKELIDDILRVFAPDFIQDDKNLGNIRLLDNRKHEGHHCVPPKQTLKQFAGRTDGVELLSKVATTCPTWVYVYMRHRTTPTNPDAIHFHKGLETLEKMKVYNIKADDYLPSTLPKTSKPCNAILVGCKSEEAEKRITALGGFSFDLENEHATFFIHNRNSWGNVVSVDIHNAMDNINDVLALVLTHFQTYMAWEKWTDTEKHPVYLTLAKIPDGPTEGRMTTAQMVCNTLRRAGDPQNWKLAFVPRLDRIMSLKIPKVAGQWAKGTVNMTLPDFCQSCTSYSHTPQYWAWWTVPGVLTRIKCPQGFQELEWTVVEAVTPQPPHRITSKMIIEIPSTREGTPADPTPAEAKRKITNAKGKGKARAKPLGPPQPTRRK